MLTYFCCTIEKFSPCFLLYDSLSEVFKKTYNASCSQLDKGTPLSARWLRREPLLKRASCSQLDKGTPLSARWLRREPLLKRVAFCVHIVRPCLVFSLSSSNFFLFLSCSASFLFLSCSALSRTSPLQIPRSSRGMTKKKKSRGMTKKKKS